MIPNNNLSVLPWYGSINEQNARRWWVYNRVYPLFTPAKFLLPFQIMREPLLAFTPTGSNLPLDDSGSGYIVADGSIAADASYQYKGYDVTGLSALYFTNLCQGPGTIAAAAYDSNNNLLGLFEPEFDADGYYTGGWLLPAGTTYIYAQSYNANLQAHLTLEIKKANTSPAPVTKVEIYAANGALIGDYSGGIIPDIAIKQFSDYDVIVYPGENPFATSFDNGQYYAKLTDGTNTWYSEIFTVVNDTEPYLKITWFDQQDFIMDAGAIVYKYWETHQFKNVLLLDSNIAKPEYPFEEEGETRDGYFFPVKLISEKRYRFKFLASEYLLDVMRFIRMADYVTIEYHGQTYTPDTFLITPEWEDNGDVAAVEAVFETATVAKKIGGGYIKQS